MADYEPKYLPTPDKIKSTVHNHLGKLAEKQSTNIWRKGRRPLKMPKDYDFSQRGVDWTQYKYDYLLRTDAVWEKIKMKDVFYAFYKTHFYEPGTDRYWLMDIREHMYPTSDRQQLPKEYVPFAGYSPKDGVVWQFNKGPMVARPDSYTDFVAEKERDNWSHCTVTLNKWLLCNDRSPIKLDELHLFNNGFYDYPCFNELEKTMETCGGDMFEKFYEMFKYRFHHPEKPMNWSRPALFPDIYGTVRERRDLYY